LQAYLKAHNPAWNLVGRVHFNLAENRGDEEAPFAFIATYTTQLSAHGRAQHLALAEALREYAGAKNKARLLSLLRPVQQAAAQCGWLRALEGRTPVATSSQSDYRRTSALGARQGRAAGFQGRAYPRR
jgi:hypothetical protein